MSTSTNNIYEAITQKVIAGLKKDGLSWFRPWNGGNSNPINRQTGKAYKGFNIFWLNTICQEQGYKHNEWLTFNQGKALGATLKDGETAKDKQQHVIFWMVSFLHEGKWYNATQLKKIGVSQAACKKSWNMRHFYVFNVSQFESLDPRRVITAQETFNPIEEAEKIYAEYDKKPTLKHGGDEAYYSPERHHVQMPHQETFITPDDYYKTLFHELTHSSGHKDSLNRKGVAGKHYFGSDEYSIEELIAELGSEYLVGLTGINPKDEGDNAQAYINGWIKQLEGDDPKTIVMASQSAMKAIDFITNK